MKFAKLTLLAISALFSVSAVADPIVMGVEYKLGNHPDGGARPPLYGLRLDGLSTGNQNDIYTFEFEGSGASMSMIWNADGTLDIMGKAYGGLNQNGGYAAGQAVLWDIAFTYENLGACAVGDGLCAILGKGTIASALGAYDMVAETGNNSYAFQLDDGHRGFGGVSGWGWVNHCPQDANDPGGNCNSHLYASDWLFTVHPVPAPGTLALLGLGLLGFALQRRGQTRSTA